MVDQRPWRRGAVAGSSASLIAVVCLLLLAQDSFRQPEERATAEQFSSPKIPASIPLLASVGLSPAQRTGSHADTAEVAAVIKSMSVKDSAARSLAAAQQQPQSRAQRKAAHAIQSVALENKGVEAEVQRVIDSAESVDKQKAVVQLEHKHGKVQVQGLAAGSAKTAKALKPTKPKLSNETLEAMREGEQAGWAADEAAKKEAAIAAKSYYEELRKEMYKEAAEHEVKERQEILKGHSLSTSEDNEDLVHALDAVYRSDGPTSTRGPLLTASAHTTNGPHGAPAKGGKAGAGAAKSQPATAKGAGKPASGALQRAAAGGVVKAAPLQAAAGAGPAQPQAKTGNGAKPSAAGKGPESALQVGPLAFLDRLFGGGAR